MSWSGLPEASLTAGFRPWAVSHSSGRPSASVSGTGAGSMRQAPVSSLNVKRMRPSTPLPAAMLAASRSPTPAMLALVASGSASPQLVAQPPFAVNL